MKIACIEGIAALARATTSAEAAAAYQGEKLTFGADYLIPKAFDPRLMGVVASAVARAAMETGVATRPIEDFGAYRRKLDGSVFRSALIMRPVFEAAATASRKIVFAEGEDERVLRCANALMEETIDRPILIGRPEVIEQRSERIGLSMRAGRDYELVNPENDPRYRDYWTTYHEIMARKGVTPDLARAVMRTNTTAIGAVMVRRGEADSLICGTFGQYLWHLNYVRHVLQEERQRAIGALRPDGDAGRAALRCRHAGQPRAHARADRGDRGGLGAACPTLRARAEDRALLAQPVRQSRLRHGAADAGRAGDP